MWISSTISFSALTAKHDKCLNLNCGRQRQYHDGLDHEFKEKENEH